MQNLFRKLVEKFLLLKSTVIYSQAGEDLILARLFFNLNIQNPTYLDIGANDPRYISNTYYFYIRGCKGICVEPNPHLYNKIKKMRKRDICINAGIGVENSTAADFYLFPDYANGLSTFSKESADYWGTVGMDKLGKINYEKIIKMPLININDLIKDNLDKAPTLLSIDVEGLDLEILKSLDFSRYKPTAICIETLSYNELRQEYKTRDVADFLKEKGYSVYADTRINTIFVAD